MQHDGIFVYASHQPYKPPKIRHLPTPLSLRTPHRAGVFNTTLRTSERAIVYDCLLLVFANVMQVSHQVCWKQEGVQMNFAVTQQTNNKKTLVKGGRKRVHVSTPSSPHANCLAATAPAAAPYDKHLVAVKPLMHVPTAGDAIFFFACSLALLALSCEAVFRLLVFRVGPMSYPGQCRPLTFSRVSQ